MWDDMLMSNVFSSIWRHVGISELCTEILKIMDEEFCKCIAHSYCWVFVNYAHCFILLFEFLVICCTMVNSFALRFWSMYSEIFLQLHMKMLADKLSIFCSVKICHYRNNRVIENCWNTLAICRTFLHDVNFAYSQDNTNQLPTNRNYYVFLKAKWWVAWVTSFVSINQSMYESFG